MFNDRSAVYNSIDKDSVSNFVNSLDFEITSFGSWVRNDSKSINNFIVTQYELSYLEKGELIIYSNNKKHILTEGSLFIFEPFTVYSVHKNYDGLMDLYHIFFDVSPEYLHGELLDLILPVNGLYYSDSEILNLGPLFSSTYTSYKCNSYGSYILVEALLKTCIVTMINTKKSLSLKSMPTQTILTTETTVVKDAITFIRNHIDKPIKIKDICNHINVSENYLYKCFMNTIKVSPKTYILQYKIKKAEQLLAYSNYNLQEIALLLGFSSSYHLSNTFKKILGHSPIKYIKQK